MMYCFVLLGYIYWTSEDVRYLLHDCMHMGQQ